VALTGLDIYKRLPRTNCRKCGFPTCLAFAMALASRKVALNACPDVSDAARVELAAAAEPPVRTVRIGDRVIGGETVLFRHEKTFVNPPLLAVAVHGFDAERIQAFGALSFDRVGQRHRTEMVMCDAVGCPVRDIAAAARLTASLGGVFALRVGSAEEARTVPADVPVHLIGDAHAGDVDAFAAVARERGVPLVIAVESVDQAAAVAGSLVAQGFRDIIFRIPGRNVPDAVAQLAGIRRRALRGEGRTLGYPTIVDASGLSRAEARALAVAGIVRYGGIIVVGHTDPAEHLALLTLRLNVYTDPQRPVAVEPKVYAVGGQPGPGAPLLVTTNFSLTFFSVEPEITNARVPSWLLVVDADGLSVLTAWAADKFTPERIAAAVRRLEAEGSVVSRTVVIPGYVSVIADALQTLLPEWRVMVGPREASGIPRFLREHFTVS